jgi:hypothetical protein
MLNVRMLNVVMLSVYAECSCTDCRYAECRYAECLYAECSYTECHYVNVLMLSVVAPFFTTTALNLMTYSIMTLSIKDSVTTFSICEINITKFDPRMSMFKLSRWLYHEKFMFCFYFGTVCGVNMFALALVTTISCSLSRWPVLQIYYDRHMTIIMKGTCTINVS